jgi:hypothetical protein
MPSPCLTRPPDGRGARALRRVGERVDILYATAGAGLALPRVRGVGGRGIGVGVCVGRQAWRWEDDQVAHGQTFDAAAGRDGAQLRRRPAARGRAHQKGGSRPSFSRLTIHASAAAWWGYRSDMISGSASTTWGGPALSTSSGGGGCVGDRGGRRLGPSPLGAAAGARRLEAEGAAAAGSAPVRSILPLQEPRPAARRTLEHLVQLRLHLLRRQHARRRGRGAARAGAVKAAAAAATAAAAAHADAALGPRGREGGGTR